ncbi:hypothetical protein [Umezawaea tangerina]|uniref:Uncharacterized protein n=1 Tax=Umezawaea tangerina TaxID=84725 RepID=A0A2T0SKY4_9PSEU|nr:hypothetical protein [Umezawaea tangerina]PRY34055.1 hypothetical protein CLV43_11881 [Umezawaea tangerina]
MSLLVAVIGLLGTAITGIATSGFSSATSASGGVLTTSANPTTSSKQVDISAPLTTGSTRTTEPAEIVFTISDQLTEGAVEELVTVSLEGSKVATLRADDDNPIVTESITGSETGNYSYVVDGAVWWRDRFGTLQKTVATGRGSVYIAHGNRLDVYVHMTTDGRVDLSLEKAG